MIEGLLLLGQNKEVAGRGIAGPRLRTAAASAGFKIEITDIASYLTEDQILALIDLFVKKGIKFLGLSTSWITIEDDGSYDWLSLEFIEKIRVKYPNLLLITGGHQASGKEYLVKVSDFYFQGFSDLSFVEFLKYINRLPNSLRYEEKAGTKMIESNLYYQVTNPNDLETVFYKNDEFLSHQPIPIELSRGCIFRCTFCRHPFQGKKDFDSYQRTPESLASELKRNYDLFGTTRYTIMDDTINDSLEKLYRLQKAIEIAKLPKFEFVGYIKPELLVTKPEMIPILANLGLRGAFIGIESFNNATRKLIGKGTDIEKIKEAMFNLATINNNQVLIYGSFIVGLPEDSPDDVYKTYEFLLENNSDFIRSWDFHPLIIINDPSLTSEKSFFDKQPERYNYTFINNHKYNWTNKMFTFDSAKNLCAHIMKNSRGKMKHGGWTVAGCWHLGMSESEIQNNILTFDFPNRLISQMKKRAEIEFNNFFKET